jgi:hypothetical protein
MTAFKLHVTAALFGVVAVLFSSCDDLANLPSPPPFSISGFEIKKGAVDTICRVASASFYFINTSSKEIGAFRICFRLYDGDKTPVGFGDNKVTFEYSGTIASGEEREIVVPLDRFIPQETGSYIVADQIFVESVLFSDGERWNDYFGVWAL